MRSLITFVVVTFTLGLAFVLCAGAGQSRAAAAHQLPVAVCHFDGGGSMSAGNAARTSDGHVWQCTEDGTLIRLSASVRHSAPRAHASLPSWVHWVPASVQAAREVCGRGVQAITIWGGSGDTSAIVCANGKADVS